MKILLGLPAARISPMKARFMIDKACADYDNIEKEFKKKLQVHNTIDSILLLYRI